MQMPLNPCDGLDDCVREETSIGLLRSVFGSTIDNLISGNDPAGAAGQTEILPAMLGYFNGGLAIVGGLLLLGIMTIGVANSANDGEVFGRNWNPTWTVARMVAGMGMLLPTTAGFSFAQVFVLMVALWGVGLANGVYKVGIEMGILAPESAVQGINHPGSFYGMRSFAQKYVMSAYCARAANEVFGEHGGASNIPKVGINRDTRDRRVDLGNSRYDVYEFKDRNKESDLAGLEPICGELRIAAQPPEATDQGDNGNAQASRTLARIGRETYTIKRSAIRTLMGDLDKWVESWPYDADQDGWSDVKSSRFNEIVRAADAKVVAALRGQGQNAEGQMDGVIQQVVEDVTRSGWAEAGTWFQKIGHIRMSLINTTAASVATIEPSFRAVTDKDDARQELFERTVNLGSKTLIKAFRRDGEEIGDANPTPARFDNLFQDIGTDGGRAPDITGFKSMLTDKLNSTSNRWIQEVTSIVTGANGGGNSFLERQARQLAEIMCGENNRIGGAINRMKCVGDMVTVTRSGLYVLDGGLKTTISIIRGGAGVFSATPIVGGISKVADVVWDWFLAFPAMHIARLGKFMEPVSFMFAVVLPSLPMMIFMVVIVGWLLGVLQTILAIPLWALLHMTPEPTFVGSQRQGYLLLLSLFARPALAVIGLFAAILISDPLVTFVVNGFFAIRGAIDGGMGDNIVLYYLSAVPQFLMWMLALSILLVVVLHMCFALPQTLPGAVLQWIGAGVTDLGESGAMGKIQGGLASTSLPVDRSREEAKKERAQLQRDERLARMIKGAKGGGSGSSGSNKGASDKVQTMSGDQGIVGERKNSS